VFLPVSWPNCPVAITRTFLALPPDCPSAPACLRQFKHCSTFACTLPHVSVLPWLCLFSLNHHHAPFCIIPLLFSCPDLYPGPGNANYRFAAPPFCPFGNFCVLGAITSSCSPRKPTPSKPFRCSLTLQHRPVPAPQIVCGHHLDLQPAVISQPCFPVSHSHSPIPSTDLKHTQESQHFHQRPSCPNLKKAARRPFGNEATFFSQAGQAPA
jgi:hypothetical protein